MQKCDLHVIPHTESSTFSNTGNMQTIFHGLDARNKMIYFSQFEFFDFVSDLEKLYFIHSV